MKSVVSIETPPNVLISPSAAAVSEAVKGTAWAVSGAASPKAANITITPHFKRGINIMVGFLARRSAIG